jgi:hypothetical protein
MFKRDAGFTAKELKKLGFEFYRLKNVAGYTDKELRDARL